MTIILQTQKIIIILMGPRKVSPSALLGWWWLLASQLGGIMAMLPSSTYSPSPTATPIFLSFFYYTQLFCVK